MAALSGMTGFARADGSAGDWRWTWEVRSVNGKGLDPRFRLPTGLEAIDTRARDAVKARFSRGNFQCALSLANDAEAGALQIDVARVEALLDAAKPYVDAGRAAAPRFDSLLTLPGMMAAAGGDSAPAEALHAPILETLGLALDGLREARHEEGRQLAELLAGHVDTIETLTREAEACDAVRLDAMRDRIAARFADLLGDKLPEDRLATEAAALAVKMDVREELDRLHAHVGSARELLSAGSPAGRKLDFLSQEFNREANTLCSKSADSSLTRIGLAIKNAVDQFREQVQNVE